MGFATAHRLLEMENGLSGNAGKASDTLSDEVLHALRDECFLEELRAVALGVDQFVELLNLVAELDGKRVGLKCAGVADGFHIIG